MLLSAKEKRNYKICSKVNGLKMYNIKQGLTISERKKYLCFFMKKIKLKVSMYVYLNKCTRRHVVTCGQENQEGCVIGSEERLNTGDACEL